MLYENQQGFINPIAATGDTHENPLADDNQEHEDTNWDTTAIAVQAVTLQQSPIMEDTTNYPSTKSIAAPTEIKKDQPERPHTKSRRRSRASHHQPITSAKAEAKRRHTTAPNQGKPPQPNQQEQTKHEHLTCGWHQLTRVENKNEDYAGRHQNTSPSQNPRYEPFKTEPELNMKTSQSGTCRTTSQRDRRIY